MSLMFHRSFFQRLRHFKPDYFLSLCMFLNNISSFLNFLDLELKHGGEFDIRKTVSPRAEN